MKLFVGKVMNNNEQVHDLRYKTKDHHYCLNIQTYLLIKTYLVIWVTDSTNMKRGLGNTKIE